MATMAVATKHLRPINFHRRLKPAKSSGVVVKFAVRSDKTTTTNRIELGSDFSIKLTIDDHPGGIIDTGSLVGGPGVVFGVLWKVGGS